MENSKKTIVLLTVVILILLIALFSVFFFRLGLEKGKNGGSSLGSGDNNTELNNSKGQEETKNNLNQEAVLIKDKEQQPAIITGKIISVEAEKLTIKQTASIDLSYEISKNDISEITIMEKNPAFNEEKAKLAQEEIAKLIPQKSPGESQALSSAQNDNNQTPAKEILAELKKKIDELNSDPELKMFNQRKTDWNELKLDSEINVNTDERGNRKIIVYPAGFLMAPK